MTPEQILKQGVEGYPLRDVINNLTDEQIIEALEEYGKQQYNQALRDAVENAETEWVHGNFYSVNPDSILKLLKP